MCGSNSNFRRVFTIEEMIPGTSEKKVGEQASGQERSKKKGDANMKALRPRGSGT